jgi:3-hydroxyisobutyrate dehydrogenase-like beta-hydroxyacid dehydrogenase
LRRSADKIGFIGFGEAAYHISKGLLKEGINEVFAYDILWVKDHESEKSQKTKQRALDIGVKPVDNVKDLVLHSYIIMSAVTPSAALDVANEVYPYLNEDKIYADINSKSPRIAKNISKVIQKNGAKFVDVAVMAAITKYGHKTPCLVSGNGSQEFSLLNNYGMNIKVIGSEPGQASAVKMLRSIFTKGVSALLLEAFTAAYEYGVVEMLFNSLEETEDSMTFDEMINLRVCSTMAHAKRRTDELEMVCDTLKDVNIEPIMSSATKKAFEKIARLEFDKHFVEWEPKNFREVLRAIRKQS